MIWWWWRLGSLFARLIPLRLCYAGAAPVADVAWWFMPTQRRNAIENMTRIVGPDSPRRARALARRSFHNYARYVVDFMRHPEVEQDELMAKLDFDGWDEVDAILAQGRGIILVLMHFGNWDLGGAALTARGYTLNVIAETQAHDRFNDAIVAARLTRGMKLLPMEKAVTGIIRALRNGEMLAILIDRPLSEGGVPVQFFGAETRVPAGPARIALRTGARLLPVSLLRVSERADRIRAIVDFSVEAVRTGDQERDVQALTQQLMAAHERVIRRYPDQWYMFRRMWPDTNAAPESSSAIPVEA